jgi:hypothetical protein
MSLRIKVDVTSAREIAKALREAIPNALDTRVREAIQTVTERIIDDARRFCPVRTGFLLSTIEINQTSGAKWVFNLVARASYAAYIEFGTHRIGPRLFMTRALEIHEWEFTCEIEAAAQQAIKEGLP